VVEFEGELDMANHDALRAAVERERADDREIVVIDLSACTYLDSTAIQELINLSNELRQALGRLVLVVPPKPSGRRRLFEVTGVDQAIEVYDSIGAAAVALGGRNLNVHRSKVRL
jgi:anti-sigma B factor antagonist